MLNDAEKVKEWFSHDLFVQGIGAQIVELSQEKTVVKTTVLPAHQNANGYAQGGMLYTVADYAFALHANYLHGSAVTQGGRVQYLIPVKVGEELTFTATETAHAGHNTVSEVVVKNSAGEIVCVCNFNGFVR
ncbi:MAG: hotdog fold thioesterase [Clostridia bacterium]|nr:hotdog fold thioesterase [Clostridia bacterium]